MSVAFTKEEDNEAAAAYLPERPISPHPNLVIKSGLANLDAALASAKEAVALGGGDAETVFERVGLLLFSQEETLLAWESIGRY